MSVGELVETARLVMVKRNETGYIRPCHIRESYRMLKLQGKLPQKNSYTPFPLSQRVTFRKTIILLYHKGKPVIYVCCFAFYYTLQKSSYFV